MALKSVQHGFSKEVKKGEIILTINLAINSKFIEFLSSAFFFMLHLKLVWNENSQYLWMFFFHWPLQSSSPGQ